MSSRSELDARRYLEALKELLKERGVTYADLADAMTISLPTVKRSLNKPSLPLDRLMELCRTGGISFDELHDRAERRRPQHHVFSDEQDQLFFEREEMLAYFLEMARDGATPAEIEERHGLDRRSTVVYLDHLERVGLVERSSPEDARLSVEPPFGFGPGSRVLRRDHRRFLETIVTRVIDADPEAEDRMAVLKALRLTDEDHKQMVAELVSVIDRFGAISEGMITRDSGSRWMVALASGPGLEERAGELPRVRC